MKKNLLTVAAMAVAAFFVSTEIAKAADVSFSGQIRTRWEANEQSGGNTANTPGFNNQTDDNIFSSVRLAATANVNETTSAFIQLQSTRNWGDTSQGTVATGAGDGNASNTVNDNDASVGVHQAYFTLKNFANIGLPLDAKVGRQEIILDGHRLFGNTVWTAGMQSHDAIMFSHAHDNITLKMGYILVQEDGRNLDPSDQNDSDVYLAHLNLKGILGGQFSGIWAYRDNGCGTPDSSLGSSCSTGTNDFHTIGGRQAGKMFGLDYRGELYYQFGRADGVANNTTGTPDVDRSAYMFGLRVGKKFNNVKLKPGLTLWYDYLSGTTDADQRDGDWNSFDTLYDTGHKFYGLQDVFLGVGQGTSSGTRGLGLEDFAVKFKLNPVPGWTLKLAQHMFWTAESATANSGTVGFTSAADGDGNTSYLGNELDVTLVNKYNANTKVMIGYSNFNGTETFRGIKNQAAGTAGGLNAGSADANWGYVQFDVKF
jgi:hypothetical protein